MEYSEYKQFTKEERELWNFRVLQGIKSDIAEIKLHLKKQNGNIKNINEWKNKITGAAAILNIVLWPIIFWLIKIHISA